MRTTENDYLDMFVDVYGALEFENECLDADPASLPAHAISVLNGNKAEPEYWAWLAGKRRKELK